MTNEPLETIVWVDDEPIMLRCIRRLVAIRSFAYESFSNPREALTKIEAGLRPEILVSDFRMPEMNGGELLKRVMEISPSTYRVLCSGSHNAEDCEKGVVQYELLKPIGLEELQEMLNNYRIYKSQK